MCKAKVSMFNCKKRMNLIIEKYWSKRLAIKLKIDRVQKRRKIEA